VTFARFAPELRFSFFAGFGSAANDFTDSDNNLTTTDGLYIALGEVFSFFLSLVPFIFLQPSGGDFFQDRLHSPVGFLSVSWGHVYQVTFQEHFLSFPNPRHLTRSPFRSFLR